MPSFEIPSRYSLPSGGVRNFEVEGRNVRECVAKLDEQHPGLGELIIDAKGEMKRFVRIFVDGELLPRDSLDTELAATVTITVVAAAAGG